MPNNKEQEKRATGNITTGNLTGNINLSNMHRSQMHYQETNYGVGAGQAPSVADPEIVPSGSKVSRMSIQNNNRGDMYKSKQTNIVGKLPKGNKSDEKQTDSSEDNDSDMSDENQLEVTVDKRIKYYLASKMTGGEIYTCYLDKKQEVALKKIDLKQITAENVISDLEKLREKPHDNVVKFLHFVEKKKKFFYIAMELGSKKSLIDLEDFKNIDEKMFLKAITLGLEYLHDHDIVHGALDPSNIQLFVGKDGIYPKLSNYALKKTDISDDGRNYLSPEVYAGKEKTKSSDICSLSGVYYFMLSDGDFPFSYGKKGVKISCKYSGEGIRFFKANVDFSCFAPDLMNKMRTEKPEDRPTVKVVLDDPYFWTAEKIMNFLREINSKKDNKSDVIFTKFKEELDKKASIIYGTEWTSKIHPELLDNINERRKNYPVNTVSDLVLSIRHKYEHRLDSNFQVIRTNTLEKNMIGSSSEDICTSHLNYWAVRFPELFTQVYQEYRKHFTV